MTKGYTNNTLATNPPGGKRHNPTVAPDDRLPTERGREDEPKRKKSASSKRRAADSAR
jgi:hypothetical protein